MTRPDVAPTIGPARPITEGHRHLEFVEVRVGAATSAAGAAISDVPTVTDAEPAMSPLSPPGESGWSLWGDLDR
jgi:hypothetical protein